MLILSQENLTPMIKAMFDLTDPAGLRLAGILDGILLGEVIVDRIPNPGWAVAQECIYGSLYLSGNISAGSLQLILESLRADRDVLLGLWPEDPRWRLVPREKDYEGEVLDFYERSAGIDLDRYRNAVPDGCEIRFVDQTLFERSINRDQHIASFGSLEVTLANLFGFYLMRGGEILCESLAGPVIRGTRELGVDTYEAYQRRGYATITCAHLIHACEQAGYQTWWNCNRTNQASAALARKLGYQKEKVYKLVAWFQGH